MQIGIFGGTFDPIHVGHLILAECCRVQCKLDQVWFMPAGEPPHKTDRRTSDSNARKEMVEFAIAGHDQFELCEIELRRDGPSFTVDTLARLTSDHPDDEFTLLLGADSLRDLPTWREPGRILQMCEIVAVNRAGHSHPPLAEFAPVEGIELADRVTLASMPDIGLSSSVIRDEVRKGRSIRYQVPRAVEVYIEVNDLYREGG